MYEQYAAAANDIAHSAAAAGAIEFSKSILLSLGVSGGVSMLAGLTLICVGGLRRGNYIGKGLRAKSKFAVKRGRH